MLIPSIDIMSGDAVQLVGGERLSINAGDPIRIAESFSLTGDIAVIDLDAASGQKPNTEVVRKLVSSYSCRVGGGIRDIDAARQWLDLGASAVIIGTAASPELLGALPRKRVIAALDTKDSIVMSHGWKKSTGESIASAITRLRPYVGGFLITTIEREGRLVGLDLDQAKIIKKLAGSARVTVAGGVASAVEVAQLDAIGIDVQAGMALYKNIFSPADCLIETMIGQSKQTDWPTVVCDESGRALGLVFSNAESIKEALRTSTGIYWSRKRGLWVKGLTSGATQILKRIDMDCDRDALKFTVIQKNPGFCHLEAPSCWGILTGTQSLEQRVDASISSKDPFSYTNRLLSDNGLLNAKIEEEAHELIATEAYERESVLNEAADLFYFTFIKLRKANLRFADLERKILERALRVTRRVGNAKKTGSTAKLRRDTQEQTP